MKKLGLFSGLFVFSVFGFFSINAFADAAIVHLTPKNPEFKISEPANPTTGYVWSIEYDHDVLDLEKENYVIKNPKLMGSGGRNYWLFKAKPEAFVKHKDSQIRLIYARPWESKEGAREMFFVVEFG